MSWRRVWRAAWSLRFVYLQAAILAATVWALLPLRDAAALPDPPWPEYTPEPPDLQETLVLGPATFAPGTQGAMRVAVYDPRNGQPIPGAEVRLALAPRGRAESGPGPQAPHTLYEGQTDDLGTAPVTFQVPTSAQGEWDLVVETRGPVGGQRIVRPVTIRRETQLDLVSDRHLYRPGQTIHLRAQALDGTNALPLPGRVVTFSVADGRDNRIWTETATTSAHGIAYANCELATRVNAGAYRVVAALGDALRPTERAVRVEPCAPPRFDLRLQAAEATYLPGQRVAATVRATYGWGEPLAGAPVQISGRVDGPQPRAVFQAQGETDGQGAFSFAFDLDSALLPERDAQGEPLILHLTATVTDAEGHVEERGISLPLAGQAMRIQAQAESGSLKPGIDNEIQVRATYADGRPAECALVVEAPGWERAAQAQTDADGLAHLRYRPDLSPALAAGFQIPLTISARDARGQEARARLELPVEAGEHHLLLRPERGTYLPGESVHLEAFTSHPAGAPSAARAVYLDVLRGGQMVAAYAAPLSEGRATLAVDLTADWFGTLTLHAYLLLADGTAVGDSRQVFVDPMRDLQVTVQADRERYVPGDTARVAVRVTDARGWGRQSTLNVAAVSDEGPLPPASSPPFSLAGAWPAGYPSQAFLPQAQALGTDDMRPLRAGAVSRPRPMPEGVKRQFEAVTSARTARRQAFSAVAQRLVWALAGAAALLWVAALAGAWWGQALVPTLRSLGCSLAGGLIALPLAFGAAALLAHGGSALFGPGALVVLGMAWFGASLALFVHAWGRRSGWAQVLWALALGCLALAAGLRYALAQGAGLRTAPIVAGLAALLCASLAAYAFGAGLARRGERGGSLAAWSLALLLLVTITAAMPAGASLREVPPVQAEDAAAEGSTEEPAQIEAQAPGMATPTPSPTPTIPVPVPPPLDGSSLETAYWNPEAVTDPLGRLSLEIPLTERPVDWRLLALASTEQGELGMAQARLDVSPPLWVETQLPASLTVGDELDLPIAVYNALPISQTVQVTATQAAWFSVRVRGMGAQQIEVPAHSVGLLYLPIRVREWGAQRLEVAVQGEGGCNVVSRRLQVLPDGQPTFEVYSGRIAAAHRLSARDLDRLPPYLVPEFIDQVGAPLPTTGFKFRVPWSAIRGTERLTVTLYPNWSSLLAEGLGRMPLISPPAAGAPLDELVATTRANALRHGGSRTSGRGPPNLRRALERALALSYQQLLTYESADGGFAAFDGAPPDLYRTAEALACLSEVAGLYPVDPALLERTAHWFYRHQSAAGTWSPQALPPTWQGLPRSELPGTAVAAWSLIESGYGDAPEVRLAIEHLELYQDQAQDPYVLALVVNALAAHYGTPAESPPSEAANVALARLAGMAEVEEGLAVWHGEVETFSGAIGAGDPGGTAADVERTALAAYALLRTGTYPQLAAQGLAWLAANRDAQGRWGSPQATFLALRAFHAAVGQGRTPPIAATVYLTVGGVAEPSAPATSPAPVALRSEESEGAQALAFDQLSRGYNEVLMAAEGLGSVPYRAVGTYYLPWDQVPPSAPEEEEVSVEVGYDRTSLAVGETITVTVGAMLNRPGAAPLAVLELGLPPGLEVVEGDWQDLLERGVVARYERVGERMVVYLADLSAERPVHFAYRLRACFPLAVKTLPTRAYDAANPQRPAVREPLRIEVTGEPGS